MSYTAQNPNNVDTTTNSIKFTVVRFVRERSVSPEGLPQITGNWAVFHEMAPNPKHACGQTLQSFADDDPRTQKALEQMNTRSSGEMPQIFKAILDTVKGDFKVYEGWMIKTPSTPALYTVSK